jgi:4-hydroxy-4-methyl-2-oxoglutarate aldolase
MKRINSDFMRPFKELIEEYAKQSTATVHEASGGKGAVFSNIKPTKPGMKVCGSALPVMLPGGDNIMAHKALYVARPGDVLVVNNGGVTEFGIWGEVMAVAAQSVGISGLVTDGSVRDSDQMFNLGFPVFCGGVCIKGASKEGLGFIGYPVNLGGVVIKPGDIILGDDDGVVVVDLDEAASVLEASKTRESKEAVVFEEIRNGNSTLEIYDLARKLTELGLEE